MVRIIAHLDMDAFFAAVEERDNPRWAGRPIVVGADPKEGHGRGVVSTANYPARAYGIHSALPITVAWRLAQEAKQRGQSEAVFLPPNFRRYTQVSRKIMTLVAKYSDLTEPVGVDEVYFDLSKLGSLAKATVVCQKLKTEISQQEGLTCSIGLAANKLVAKIASDFNKPNGLTVVPPTKVIKFLANLKARQLPGIGPKAEAVLKRAKLDSIRAIQKLTEADLWSMFGEWGLELYDRVRGRGSSELTVDWLAKSIGREETFEEDVRDSRILGDCLEIMSQQIVKSLKSDGFKTFARVVLKIRLADFSTYSRSQTLANPTNLAKKIDQVAMKLLLPFLDKRANPKNLPIRLIGVRVESLA